MQVQTRTREPPAHTITGDTPDDAPLLAALAALQRAGATAPDTLNVSRQSRCSHCCCAIQGRPRLVFLTLGGRHPPHQR